MRGSYYIIISRRNQVLLSFLRIRVIVNGKSIYPLPKKKPVIIPVTENNPVIIASDGYHFTKPLKLAFHHKNTYYFKISCIIDDDQVLVGAVLVLLFYTAGLTSDILIIKLLSFLPIFYFLFYYYIKRNDFIQVKSAG